MQDTTFAAKDYNLLVNIDRLPGNSKGKIQQKGIF
jgi:hypothetical protein